jgi:hypothetical protein
VQSYFLLRIRSPLSHELVIFDSHDICKKGTFDMSYQASTPTK